jgi:HEAT repeat protein
VQALIDAMSDPAPPVRVTAARALGEVGDGSALATLDRALADSDDEVRTAARRALRRLES